MEHPQVVKTGFQRLGLVGNPFEEPSDGSADSVGLKLCVLAAAHQLLAAIEDSVSGTVRHPIVVEKPSELPGYFSVAALATTLRAFSSNGSGGVVSAYVPIDMMRIGRVRAVLNVFAERIANGSPELLIGRWTREALLEPDVSLAEWTMLEETGFQVEIALDLIEDDAAGFAARVFGPAVESRDGAEDLETLMRVSTTRRERLESNPALDEPLSQAEEATDDPLGDAFTTPLGDADDRALPEGAQEDSTDPLLAEYVIAYTRENLSPVVARGIRAYQAQGCASMAEEMKVSKAPTKTLAALLRFAEGAYRAGVVLFDRLEMWENVPEDLRSSIVESIEALQANLCEQMVVVLMLVRGTAPELETAFADARRVVWEFKELESVRAMDAVFDPEIALSWIAAASLDTRPPRWAHDLISAVPANSGMAEACSALSGALKRALGSGSDPNPADVVSSFAVS